MIYEIVLKDTNKIIGYTEEPVFIYRPEPHKIKTCSEIEAQGIVYNNKIYSINNSSIFKDTKQALLKRVDINDFIFNQQQNDADITYIAMETGIDLDK